MSGIVNKVREALHSDKSHDKTHETTHTTGTGHHDNLATGTNVGGYQDPAALHSHEGTTHTAGHHTASSGTAGPSGNSSNVTGYNDPTGTHGPHGSRVANAADPRVDSDRDHRGAGTGAGFGSSNTTGHHTGHTGAGTGAGFGSSNTTTGYDDPTGTHGPHGSRVANAADPRVDSDRDHRAAGTGAGFGSSNTTGYGDHTTHTGHTGHTGAGTGAGFGSSNTTGYGDHTSHTGHTGAGTGAGFGSSNATTGYNDPVGTHGTHNSRVANAADPRIDSDRDHRNATGTAGTAHYGSGPGPAANTAGPHKSDVLNKADPRVDSDLDGSKTYGGDKTYQQSGTGTTSLAHKDPTDAAQVPPSVLREHIGDPVIEHGDHTHAREGRHQSISHQEAHRGI